MVGATADLVVRPHSAPQDRLRLEPQPDGSGRARSKSLAEVRNRAAEWAAESADVAVLDRDQVVRASVARADYVGAFLDRRGGNAQSAAAYSAVWLGQLGGGARFTAKLAVALERTGQNWKVSTSRGAVTASHAVLCTNGYTDRLWPGLRRLFSGSLSGVATAAVRQSAQSDPAGARGVRNARVLTGSASRQAACGSGSPNQQERRSRRPSVRSRAP